MVIAMVYLGVQISSVKCSWVGTAVSSSLEDCQVVGGAEVKGWGRASHTLTMAS